MYGEVIQVKRDLKIGFVMAAISSILYGTYPVLAKCTLQSGVNAVTLPFLRYLGCSLILLGGCTLARKKWPSLKVGIRLLLIGGIVYAGNAALYLLAISMLPAGMVSVIVATYPIFVVGFSVILGQKKWSWRILVTFSVCICGLGLVMNIDTKGTTFTGILIAIATSVTYAIYILSGNQIDDKEDPFVIASFIMTGACVAYLIVGILTRSFQFNFDYTGWCWTLSMVFLTTVIPVILFWSAVRKTGVVRASSLGALEPTMTVILSACLLGEMLTLTQLIGVILVLSCITLIQMM